MTYRVACRVPALVALPVSYNSYTGVLVEDGAGFQPMAVLHVANDPRLCDCGP